MLSPFGGTATRSWIEPENRAGVIATSESALAFLELRPRPGRISLRRLADAPACALDLSPTHSLGRSHKTPPERKSGAGSSTLYTPQVCFSRSQTLPGDLAQARLIALWGWFAADGADSDCRR